MDNLQRKEELRAYLQHSFSETNIEKTKPFVSSLAEKVISGEVQEVKKKKRYL